LTWTQEQDIVTGFLHEFKVSANNGKGESATSTAVQIYAATIPDKPLNLAKVSADSTYVMFDWEAPVSDGGSPILDYQVYWDEGKSNNVFVVL
jgi:hypothetical protein